MRPRYARVTVSLAAFLAGALTSIAAHSEELQALQWDPPIQCMKDPSGKEVRVQCDPPAASPKGLVPAAPKRCLVAPNRMSIDGGELDLVQECVYNDDPDAYKKLVASGARMVTAIAEAPPGYARAETGRAYQVKFDLLNRIYLGVSWLPTLSGSQAVDSSFSLGRAQGETGFHISVLSPKGRSRHDIRLLEGSAAFGDMELRGLLFSYDYQHLHRRPGFWLTSFFGPPQVYSVTPGLGWGFRLLNVNDRPPGFQGTLDMEFAEMHLSWNPWQSNDMFSHLRIEAGGDFGKFWEDRGLVSKGLGTGSWYAGFSSAVKARLSLGEGGLHYLFLDVSYLRPTFLEEPFEFQGVHRVRASVAYEAIFVAINDQPLSLRVAAVGGSRENIRTGAQSVEGTFTAGLRFSFWAPPRKFEPLPEFEDP